MNRMAETAIHRRIRVDKLFKALVIVLSLSSIVPMFLILFMIAKNGVSVIDWQFLSHLPKPVGEAGGGIANALWGTLLLIALSFVFSVPLGVFGGIFLAEYRGSKLAYPTRLSVGILQGIPSIVIGIIAYVWVVMPMGSFSALSGGVALGIMMLPVIVMATEETLKLVWCPLNR